MRRGLQLACLWCSGMASAQTYEPVQPTVEPAEGPAEVVTLHVQDQSLFADRVASALVFFESVVSEAPAEWPQSDSCQILEIELRETPSSTEGASVAVVRFLPTGSGLMILPAFEFSAPGKSFRTEPKQLRVREPLRSAEMALTWQPHQQTVYVGQPLRVDLRWESSLAAGRLQALQLNPAFFQDPEVEVVIPRHTGSEEGKVGLPVGGRRVIATRTLAPSQENALGQITLPLFLRFSQPGRVAIPETRLECAYLAEGRREFARYAAHFNNSFFEPTKPSQLYDRLFTTADAWEIEVLPLPPAPGGAFSGWFEPVEIDIEVQPTEVKVGDLLSLEIALRGEVPHGLRPPPSLVSQPGLRSRFLVDEDFGKRWHPEGTLFQTRVRALSSSVQAFPALEFVVFDPVSGAYRKRRTEALPLQVAANQGREFLALRSFANAAVPLTAQPEGIWHNQVARPWHDVVSGLLRFFDRAFWVLLWLGPIAFALAWPLVRERRRRAQDPEYRQQAEAYARFRRTSEGSPAHWQAFLDLLGACFQARGQAWTAGDTEKALAEIEVPVETRKRVASLHAAIDAERFRPEAPTAKIPSLREIARQVRRACLRLALIWGLGCSLAPSPARAGGPDGAEGASRPSWEKAERLFADAQQAGQGTFEAQAAYREAALQFEATALAGERIDSAWQNAGNAWFEAGDLGRAILAYRQAELFRPFDAPLAASLTAARALARNEVVDKRPLWERVSGPWPRIATLGASLAFWLLLSGALRYRGRAWWIAVGVAACLFLGALVWVGAGWAKGGRQGAVVVEAASARKGPGYAYAPAFQEPLHDGLELS
ncbi:MAG: hypothetical protein AAF555_11670, partial [Verrucomicrobiota bacterium]